jgi:N-acetylglucosamine-6-phosphate deacetylase
MNDKAKTGDDWSNSPVLLSGARVVLPDRTAGEASLLVEGGRIARVYMDSRQPTDDAARNIDLRGLTIYPGFIDAHIHGSVGVDVLDASTDDLQRVARFLASRGVTAWLPTLVPAPDEDYRRAVHVIEGLIRWQSDDDSDAARSGREVTAQALGVHYEGPFVNVAQCGALRTEFFRTYKDDSNFDELPTLDGARAVHMITVAPEIDGGIALIQKLVASRWIVSIGHTRADLQTLDAAREAGARHMTHFFNAMSPLHHRAPGVVGWGLLEDGVTCDVIADGVHCDPLMLRLALRCKTAGRLSLISDAVLPAGLGDGEYKVWGETISVTDGRTRNARGSIAGSAITMLDAARLMLSLGVPEHEVAHMASLTPARLLRVDQERGSIEEGKRADLVALDADGHARLTLIDGRVAFNDFSV